MVHYPYLIIGGGMTGAAAVRGIRRVDTDGEIHEDNARLTGETAGRNMAGDQVRYDHLPFFCSDLFDLGYETARALIASPGPFNVRQLTGASAGKGLSKP